MSEPRIIRVAPDDPRAVAAVGTYFAEIDSAFEGGFVPGGEDDTAFRPPSGVFLLVVAEGRTLGCGGVRTIQPGVGEVKRMWVSPAARGMGTGRRLLAVLEDEAAALGASIVRLDTNDVLHSALALYRSSGYTEIERYNDNPHARHWFEKRLASAGPPTPL